MKTKTVTEAFEAFAAIDAERDANRDRMTGKIKNQALDRRIINRERDLAIEILGYKPEDRSSADTRYAATTGEFRRWAMEQLYAARDAAKVAS